MAWQVAMDAADDMLEDFEDEMFILDDEMAVRPPSLCNRHPLEDGWHGHRL
jgi:hypothetical protein